MAHSPPVDQHIVDLFFKLNSSRSTKPVAWLYGMTATYGITPEQLNEGWWWNKDSVHIASKKRAIRPLHPQWVLLFNLKEKQPTEQFWDCFHSMRDKLYQLMAHQQIDTNITDLVFAHRMRKQYYCSKQLPVPSSASRSFASVS